MTCSGAMRAAEDTQNRQRTLAAPQDDPTRRLLAPRRLGQPLAAPKLKPLPGRPGGTSRPVAPWLAVLAVLAALLTWIAWRAGSTDTLAPPPEVERVAPALPPTPPVAQPAPPPAASPTSNPTAVPVAGVDEILGAPTHADWRVWRFKGNPAVLVIEFPSLHEQGLAMNRLAAMFEKRSAPRERLLSDQELATLVQRSGDSTASFYQGHDYSAAKAARFFSLAASTQAALNPQELRLLATLLDTGVLAADRSAGFSAPRTQAVVSFSALQADDPATAADETIDPARRRAVLQHELSHGEYFTNPAYRAHAQAFWKRRLSAPERKLWKTYLASLDYNADDEDLMANETQAMLMHTPDPRAFHAGALGTSDNVVTAWRERFRVAEPAHGLASAGR
jgi:hypothetical protein